jgi:hypothetical protein
MSSPAAPLPDITTLCRGSANLPVPTAFLHQHCGQFASTLTSSIYQVRAPVSPDNLQLFVNALSGQHIQITSDNVRDLTVLSHEFTFAQLSANIDNFQKAPEHQIVLLQATIVRLERQISALTRTGRVLNLQPDLATLPTWATPADFTNLTSWSERITEENCGFPKFTIAVEAVEAHNFLVNERFDANGLLRDFDIIFVGGWDRSFDGLQGITPKVAAKRLKPFWDGGGAILLLHDVFGPFQGFLDQYHFGTKPSGSIFQSATVVKPSRVMGRPFRLPTTIQIAETHSYYKSDNSYTVLENHGMSYYAEFGRLGKIEMCHKQPETEDEWKLLVNIVCQLVLCPLVGK